MEDKRIHQTKKILKTSLIDLLSETPYEKITVINICSRADISRITFYKHYSDKSALLDDIFSEMYTLSESRYHEFQKTNNPELIPERSFCNLLNSIIDIYYENFNFFRHTAPKANPNLYYTYQSLVMRAAENIIIKDMPEHLTKYSSRQIAAFLCFGMIGFINECHAADIPLSEVRKNATKMVMDILHSKILIE